MKAILVLAALVAIACALPSDEQIKVLFSEYTSKYGKVYAAEEIDSKLANFKASLARVETMNARSSDAVFGINKFSDMSTHEFRTTVLMSEVPQKPQKATHNAILSAVKASVSQASQSIQAAVKAAPATFDWRDKNAVTPVKDQGQCGSCWAFSASEAIESAWILKGKATTSTINLSPQQIVDCDTIDGVAGCNGGLTESAYDYIVQAGGQEQIANYPYTGVNDKCAFNSKFIDAKISGYTSISKNEATLPDTLSTTGPLSICLDAAAWQDYSSGVLTNTQCCPLLRCQMDHCVQLVGYNSTASTPYWIVRNSWNTDWGVKGYIYLEMNKNTCGLANDVTWPTVSA